MGRLGRLAGGWVLAGVAAGFSMGRAETAPPKAPEKPVNLSLKELGGGKGRLSDLRGKVVVVNFWATWCGPCAAEMPLLIQAVDRYKGRNVAFVGISIDDRETERKVPEVVKRRGLNYAIWVGADDDAMSRMGAGKIVPATVILDEKGIVRARILGQLRPGEVEERVDWLLDGDGAPAALVQHL